MEDFAVKRGLWCGLKELSFKVKDKNVTIWYLGKCVDGWKDFYGDLKPWQKNGYSNPIFCKSKNWCYDKVMRKNRVIFCLLWHCIQWC